MKFEIRKASWFKRRAPTTELQAVSVLIPEFLFRHGHFCDMFVTYEDGSKQSYNSRVLQNQITKKWCVDGMHVIVDVVEEE